MKKHTTHQIKANLHPRLYLYPLLCLFVTAPLKAQVTEKAENQNPDKPPVSETQNGELTYGKSVRWYEGDDRSPKLFTGYLTLTKHGYAFTVKANESDTKKLYSVSFYDEDAEVEAVDIANENKDKPENIQLLGYPIGDKENKIEVIYGLDLNTPFVSPLDKKKE